MIIILIFGLQFHNLMSSTPFYGIALRNGMQADPSHFATDQQDREAYEVFRVIDAKPLFFKEHLQRLDRTLRLTHADVHPLAPDLYIKAMHRLQELNQISDANVRMSLFVSPDGSVEEWWMGFTPHKYPSEKEYYLGVPVLSLEASRTAPNAKLVQAELRGRSEEIMAREGVYEIILLEPDGEITEASRSNIFFIKSDIIYTAPDHKVLEGVTRRIVLENILQFGLPFRMESLNLADIASCDGAFLTGTSRNVLPISTFDKNILNPSHTYISQLQEEYEKSVQRDLVSLRGF
jgi:branched-chain amino acid aminotransferase